MNVLQRIKNLWAISAMPQVKTKYSVPDKLFFHPDDPAFKNYPKKLATVIDLNPREDFPSETETV